MLTQLVGSAFPPTNPRYDVFMDIVNLLADIEKLDPDALRKRLTDLDREQAMVRVLLRSVLTRRRQTAAMGKLNKPEVSHANRPAK
jgi:hypothetical protein